MHKEESYYNENGEKVFSRTTRFTGRFHEDKGYSFYAHGKSVCSRVMDYPSSLSKSDLGNLLLLSHHLLPHSNVIGYRGNKGKKAMGVEQIGEVIGLQGRQAQRFLKKMMDSDVIAKRGMEYVMNPLYFLNGKTIEDELYWLFQAQLDTHLSAWVRDTYRKRRDKERDV
jgi:hypothetical protein